MTQFLKWHRRGNSPKAGSLAGDRPASNRIRLALRLPPKYKPHPVIRLSKLRRLLESPYSELGTLTTE